MQVKLLALFVLAGGFVGGLTFWTAIFVWGTIKSITDAMPLPDNTMAQFVFLAPIAALFGIVLGAPSALPTGLVYAFGPQVLRRPWRIAMVGAGSAALSAAAFFYFQPDVDYLPPDPYLEYCIMLALAGGVATLVCLWLVRRWNLGAT